MVMVELQTTTATMEAQMEGSTGELAPVSAAHLFAEFGDAFAHESRIEFVVAVRGRRRIRALNEFRVVSGHDALPAACLPRSVRTLGPLTRIFSR